MATAQVKRETLKNIGNVQDWALKQRGKDKKEVTKPVKPRSTASKPKITKHAPTPVVLAVTKPLVVPQPIKEEVIEPIDHVHSAPAGAKVRRIYSREFLIKFKYSATPFSPGAQTPLDLINQYNKEFELREQQRMAENSAQASTTSILSVPQPISTAGQVEPRTITTTTDKKVKKIKKEGEEKHFKLRLGTTDESLLRSPLFRASATKAPIRHQTPPSSATIKGDDKENPVPVKSVRSSSVKRHAESPAPIVSKKETKKAPKLPSIPSSAAPTPIASVPAVVAAVPSIDSFAVPIAIAAEPTPAPAPAAVAAPTAAPVDAVMTEDKQDLVDVLSKKLKNALKETDPRRLAQRQKQIDYGKATAGYQDYCKQTPKSKRKREDPKTPNKYQVCSKRSWDGQIRKWRRMLHMYDPVELKEAQAKNPTDEDIDMGEGKGFSFEITAADLLAEEKALLE